MNSKQEQFTFEGFESANTTPVPDILFDALLADLNGAELKVLLYIIRRTWGFKKETDAISLTQFEKGIVTREGKRLDYGCGLNRETICKALQSLEAKGYIKSQKRTAHKRDKDVTLYSIHFKSNVGGKTDHVPSRKTVPPSQAENPTTVGGKTDQGSRKTSKMVVGKSDPQETVLQETVLQETVKQQTESITPRESMCVVSDANASAACESVLPEIVHQANEVVPSKEEEPSQRQTKKDIPSKSVDLLVTASLRARQVIADWQAIFPKSRKPITKLLIEAAEQLALCDPTAEDIATCRLWLYKTDKNRWYASHGMCLGDLARNWEKWQSTRDAPPVQPDSSNGKGAYVSGGKLVGKLPYHLCFWQGKIMPKEEAHDLGWNGGFEAYN